MPTSLTRITWYEDSDLIATAASTHIRTVDVGGFHLTEAKQREHFRTPVHSHDVPSVYLLLEGSVTERFGRRVTRRSAGELVFTPPAEPHSNDFHAQGAHCFFFELDPAVVRRVEEHGKLPGGPTLLTSPLQQLAVRLYREFSHPDPFLQLVVESIGLELTAELCRLNRSSGKEHPPAWLDRAKEFLDHSFAGPCSLTDVAQIVGCHPAHLARLFRRHYRCTVGEYVRFRRVEAARLALTISSQSLAEIAGNAGFADQSHFCKTFRALVGVAPSRYRSQMCRSHATTKHVTPVQDIHTQRLL